MIDFKIMDAKLLLGLRSRSEYIREYAMYLLGRESNFENLEKPSNLRPQQQELLDALDLIAKSQETQ